MKEILDDFLAATQRLGELRSKDLPAELTIQVNLANHALIQVIQGLRAHQKSPAEGYSRSSAKSAAELSFDEKQQVALVTLLEVVKLSNKGVLPGRLPTLVDSVKLAVLQRYRYEIESDAVNAGFQSLIAGGNLEVFTDPETYDVKGYKILKTNLV